MDSKRFDNWTRNRALRLSRRDALKLVGAGSAAAALPAFAPDTLAQGNCSLKVHAQTGGGPTAPTTYDGTLTFSLGPDGTFTQASFASASNGTLQATGAATGRAIDFSVTLSGNQMLTFSGATEQPLSVCQGAAAGIFSGPQLGDLGAWQSTSSNSGSSTNCQSSQTACGPNCCPSGATCTNTTQGLCACPNGTQQCGVSCVPSCTDGQPLDLDTCTCPDPIPTCINNQQTCQDHDQCCSGYCGFGTCVDCEGIVCGHFGCVDPSKDSRNCGSCGTACIYPQVCIDGVCGCAPDGTSCVNHGECCSELCFVNACTTCSDVTNVLGLPLTFCAPGVCVDLAVDINNCGACSNICPRTSAAVICEAGVCHDLNSDSSFCGLGHVVCPTGKICYLGACITP